MIIFLIHKRLIGKEIYWKRCHLNLKMQGNRNKNIETIQTSISKLMQWIVVFFYVNKLTLIEKSNVMRKRDQIFWVFVRDIIIIKLNRFTLSVTHFIYYYCYGYNNNNYYCYYFIFNCIISKFIIILEALRCIIFIINNRAHIRPMTADSSAAKCWTSYRKYGFHKCQNGHDAPKYKMNQSVGLIERNTN